MRKEATCLEHHPIGLGYVGTVAAACLADAGHRALGVDSDSDRIALCGAIDGLRVGVLGLAFKPNTDDVREAPSLDMINTLCDDGAIVSAYDPEAVESARPHLQASVRLVTTCWSRPTRRRRLSWSPSGQSSLTPTGGTWPAA